MSTSIDNKVVSIEFDNAKFEKNVKTSMNSLGDLQKSIDKMDGSNSGLSNLADGVEKVGVKFSALETIALGFLTKLGSMAAEVGTQMVKSLSIDQITAGFSKYEQKTQSVQTIMAATGETIETVSEQLSRLNWFSDETSYSFADMANNIGKFTSNGVDLDTAVVAMEGISNWAALSGQNTEAASRAMYNLSQAISVGSVKLIDWKSIENANMATTEFKQTAIDTAVALGQLTDEGNGMYKTLEDHEFTLESFNTYLSDAWFSSEVLLETLNKYGGFSDDLEEIYQKYVAIDDAITTSDILSALEDYDGTLESIDKYIQGTDIDAQEFANDLANLSSAEYELGTKAFKAAQEAKTFSDAIEATKDAVSTLWMNNFETIFGNYEEAKTLWTDLANWLYDVFTEDLWVVNDILNEWKDAGGRTELLDGVYNVFDAFSNLMSLVREALSDIFGGSDAALEALNNFTKSFKSFSEKLTMSDETAENFKSTIRGLASILDIAWQLIKGIASGIKKIFEAFAPFSGNLLSLTAKIGDLFVKLDNFIKEKEVFTKFFTSIGTGINYVITAVNKIIDFFKDLKDNLSGVKNAAESVNKVFEILGEKFKSFKNSLGKFSPILTSIGKIFITVANKVIELFGKVADVIGSCVKNANFDAIFSIINEILGGSIVLAIKKFIDTLTEVPSKVGGIFDTLKKSMSTISESFASEKKAGALMKFAIAVGILAASLVALSLVDTGKLLAAVGAISLLTEELVQVLGVLGGTSSVNSSSAVNGAIDSAALSSRTSALIKFAAAIGILALSLKTVGELDPEGVAVGLAAISALMWEVVGIAKVLDKEGMAAYKGSTSLIMFAAGIAILGGVIKSLSQISWEELAIGLSGLTSILGLVVGFSITMDKTSTKTAKAGVGIIIFAAGIKVLASVVKDLAYLSWTELGKGMASLAAIMGLVVGYSITMSKTSSKTASAGAGLVLMAAGLKIIASVIKDLSSLSWEELAKGLATVAAVLGVIIGFSVTLSSTSSSLIKTGAGLVIFATGVVILGGALKILATLNWAEIAKGFVALAASLGVILGFSVAMTKTGSSLIKLGAGLVIFAAGMAELAIVLKVLGSMDLKALAVGLGALAATLAIVGAAAYLLSDLVGTIALLGASFALFGVGLALIGVGILSLSVAITSLGVSFEVAGAGITAFIEYIIDLIPTIMQVIAKAIVGIAEVIGNSAPTLIRAFVNLVKSMCSAIVELVPTLAETLISVLSSLKTYIPQFVEVLADLIISTLDSLSIKMPEILQAIVRFINNCLEGAIGLFEGLDFASFSQAILSLSTAALELGVLGAITSEVGPGVLLGIAYLAAIIAAMTLLAVGIGALVTQFPDLAEWIKNSVEIFGYLGEAIGQLAGGILAGISTEFASALPAMGTYLSEFMTNLQPFIDGLQNINGSIIVSALALAGALIAMTAGSLVSGIATLATGGIGLMMFSTELKTLGKGLMDFQEATTGLNAEACYDAAKAGVEVALMLAALPNSGGLFGAIFGENDASQFAESLPAFGTALKGFSTNVAGMDAQAVSDASEAGIIVCKMLKQLPNSGGWAATILGDNDISQFQTSLPLFGMALTLYSHAVSGMDTDAVTDSIPACEAIVDLMKSLPNSGGLISLFTGDNDIIQFQTTLPAFGSALKGFSDNIQGFKSTTVKFAAEAAMSVTALMSSLPNDGGIVDKWFGSNNISSFETSLPAFGTALKGFSDNIQGFDSKTVKSAGEAGLVVTQLMNSLPNDGGIFENWFGSNSITQFQDSLPAFATSLKDFSDNIQGFDPKTVRDAGNAGMAITNLMNSLPNEGGAMSWFIGDNNVDNFANLGNFGKALKEFSDEVGANGGISTDAVETSKNAGLMISDLLKSLPNDGGLIDEILGSNDYTNFTNLGDFGAALKGFSDAVSEGDGINETAVQSAANAGSIIAELAKNLPDSGGAWADMFGDNDLETFGSQLVAFGGYLIDFNDQMAGHDLSGISGSWTQMISDLAQVSESGMGSLMTSGQDLVQYFADGILNNSEVANDNFKIILIGICGYVDMEADTITGSGEKFTEYFAEGLTNTQSAVESAMSSVVEVAYNAILQWKSNFIYAGVQLDEGLIAGLEGHETYVYNKAYEVGQTAYKAFCEATEVNSPSKLFAEGGMYLDMGLANGLNDYAHLVSAAGENIGSTAFNSMNNALNASSTQASYNALGQTIAAISNMVNSDIDTNPTIRPVMDLSDIKNGTLALNSMLGWNTSVGVMANVNSINKMMSKKNQNGTLDDVVAAVNALNGKVDNMNNTTYNVNGITYDDGSNISEAVRALVTAARVERRM